MRSSRSRGIWIVFRDSNSNFLLPLLEVRFRERRRYQSVDRRFYHFARDSNSKFWFRLLEVSVRVGRGCYSSDLGLWLSRRGIRCWIICRGSTRGVQVISVISRIIIEGWCLEINFNVHVVVVEMTKMYMTRNTFASLYT